MKRLTFILLSLLVIGGIGFSSLAFGWAGIVMFPLLLVFYGTMTMLGNIIYTEVTNSNSNTDEFIPLFLGYGLISLFFKRIYYMDVGYLYCHFDHNKNTATVYQQNWFRLEKKFECHFFKGDLDRTKDKIIDKIKVVYRQEIEQKRERQESKDRIKNWNGSLDKASNRDMRLNKILKK